MDYLVHVTIDLPDDFDDGRSAALINAERERGSELVRSGHIRDIWRVDGAGLRNVGIWRAGNLADLNAQIASLPLFKWMTFSVTALHPHPLSHEMERP